MCIFKIVYPELILINSCDTSGCRSRINQVFNIAAVSKSNSSDPDQAGHFVGPDVVANCMQKILRDDIRR